MQNSDRQARQTDRATWWSITAFNEDAELLMEIQGGSKEFPPFVKELFGGMEKCPNTGRLHFQGAIHTAQTRFSAIKGFLPTAHIEPLKSNAQALKKYVMKEETAVGEKREVINNKYVTFDGVLMLVGEEMCKCVLDNEFELHPIEEVVLDRGYRCYARRIVYEKPHLANVLSQPQTERAWKMFAQEFFKLAQEKRKLKEEVLGEETDIVLPVDE